MNRKRGTAEEVLKAIAKRLGPQWTWDSNNNLYFGARIAYEGWRNATETLAELKEIARAVIAETEAE